MPKSTPQGHHRFAFSSGARPLDGYTIKRAIGRGGFGEVYYATSDSGKEVALKLILHNLEVERRGVVQCMNLKCPNLLTIHDLKSNDAGDSFVIMEYVAGPSLAHLLAQHPNGLPPAEVRAWLKGLVDGVAYLHDHGIVHRDLKPANMFMEEGIVKIGDYGLAKLINATQGSEHSESIGTCHYMAPEIASGKYHKPIDVYAIGVILYEMLTGRVPFEGESVGEVLMKHLTARPDLSMLAEPYRSIVARALAKDPSHRPGRLYELLPPADAPKTPPVRFIGDGKVAPPLPPDLVIDDKEKEEEVLRIGLEEPVFYIGPDTKPPRSANGAGLGGRMRLNWAALRRPAPRPRAAAPPPPPPRPAAAPRPVRRAPAPPPPPAAPPPLPGSRIRVAELSTAMLWSAVLTALLTLGTGAVYGIDATRSPERLTDLFLVALAGSWVVLGENKALEGRKLEPKKRRFLNLVLGMVIGAAAFLLNEWLRIGPQHQGMFTQTMREFGVSSGGASLDTDFGQSLAYFSTFGLMFLATNGWKSLAARDRKARFRVLPVLGSALIAALLIPLSPHVEPFGIATAVTIAIVTQLVSPWNAAAAAYARAYPNRLTA
jgi:hypothetical protein